MAFVRGVSGASLPTLGGSNLVISTPAGAQAGDWMFCFINISANVTITPPGGAHPWTTDANVSGVKAYRRKVVAGEPATHTFVRGTATNTILGSIVAVAGLDPTTPVQTSGGITAQAAGTGTSIIIPSLTATTGTWLLQIAHVHANTTFTPPGTASEDADATYASQSFTAAAGHETIGAGATGTRTWTAGASGQRSGIMYAAIPEPPNDGSASGTWTTSDTASGETDYTGSATGTWTTTGTASGDSDYQGSGTGADTWTGTASGTTENSGSSTGTHSWTGTASGENDPTGSATGAHSWTGTASGASGGQGAATGAWSTTDSASGTKGSSGSAVGGWDFTGTAAGSKQAKGAASGAWVEIGTATGSAEPQGAGTGAHLWTGTAAGIAPQGGTATGSHSWSGTAQGFAILPLPVREPTLTISANPARVDIRPNPARTTIRTNPARLEIAP